MKCPICKNSNGGQCTQLVEGVNPEIGFDCDICGKFYIYDDAFSLMKYGMYQLNSRESSALSHKIWSASRSGGPVTVSRELLRRTQSDSGLPNPATQAINIIRYIGDEVSRTGEPLSALPLALPAIAGSPNREFAVRLVAELCRRGLLAAVDASADDGSELMDVGLTLDGWDRYEAEKRGQFAGKYGFIALKFGDAVLDPLVNDCIKPAVSKGIGYGVVDMRDVARAGIIDNLMREQIRDAAFVIVDLTHDNAGAYWEAGYAEGLGKPVVYICERQKFSEARTHFDTNHCTTVIWSNDDRETFEKELIATLRRSLDLF